MSTTPSTSSTDSKKAARRAKLVPRRGHLVVMDQVLNLLEKNHVVEIMPEGLVNGVSLWVRLGGPVGTKAFMSRMAQRPPANTRMRSGWMAGVALLIAANRKKLNDLGANIGKKGGPEPGKHKFTPEMQQVARKETEAMYNHLDAFAPYLDEFKDCIYAEGNRVKVIVAKERGCYYFVSAPPIYVDPELGTWCLSKWPKTDEAIPTFLKIDEITASEEEVRAACKLYNVKCWQFGKEAGGAKDDDDDSESSTSKSE